MTPKYVIGIGRETPYLTARWTDTLTVPDL